MAAAAGSSTTKFFTNITNKLDGYDLRFTVEYVPLFLVNGIRRFSMNSIPIGGFRDEPPSVAKDKRSIAIHQNHTLLYNEMIVTRIAMIPIKQDKLPLIFTKWDSETNTRKYYWERQDTLPISNFTIKSSEQEPGKYDITTDDINVSFTSTDGVVQTIPSKEFFVRDLVIDQPALIHCLMFPYPSIEIPFEFTATPTIGTGRENASYTPVGTTSMRFMEDEERVKLVFQDWMAQKKQERVDKGIPPLSEEELGVMERNFMLLEKQRIYKQDARGPTHFNMRIESIGSMKSCCILRESLKMMRLHNNDLYHSIKDTSIHFKDDNRSIEINLGSIDHTISQCLVETWKLMPISKTFSMPSYRLIHPLKETMIMTLVKSDSTQANDPKPILEGIHQAIAIIIDDISYLIQEIESMFPELDGGRTCRLMDSPPHYTWIETIPLTTLTHLPGRPERSSWSYESSQSLDES